MILGQVEAGIQAEEGLLVTGKIKPWFKLRMEESPVVFENWMETPPQMIRMHIPINPPKAKGSKIDELPEDDTLEDSNGVS